MGRCCFKDLYSQTSKVSRKLPKSAQLDLRLLSRPLCRATPVVALGQGRREIMPEIECRTTSCATAACKPSASIARRSGSPIDSNEAARRIEWGREEIALATPFNTSCGFIQYVSLFWPIPFAAREAQNKLTDGLHTRPQPIAFTILKAAKRAMCQRLAVFAFFLSEAQRMLSVVVLVEAPSSLPSLIKVGK